MAVRQCYGRRRDLELDKLRRLLGIRRMNIVPNGRIRELCRVKKGLDKGSMKAYSGGEDGEG